ncbi:MAG TPA: YqgE/AlgH family protein [Mycobacteriales bacterium]|nr:YqgE/AlgH family protein [Mycobacteriales bacterium]
MTAVLTGRLLVATPALVDPHFLRTVLLILDHDEDGTIGVVLNRPSELLVEDGLPGWERLAPEPPVIFHGGPVSPGSAICLGHRRPGSPAASGFRPVTDRIGLIDLERDVDDLLPAVDAARVCSGYAGWGPGQLQGEIDEGAWFVVDATEGDATSSEPERLWERVLRRQPPPLSWVSLHPLDPTLN